MKPSRFVWKQGDLIFPLCCACPHKHPHAATCDAFPYGVPEKWAAYLLEFLAAGGPSIPLAPQVTFCRAVWAALCRD